MKAGGFYADKDFVYAALSDGTVVARNEDDGKLIWEQSVSSAGFETSPVYYDGQVFVQDTTSEVFALARSDGTTNWSYNDGGSFDSGSDYGGPVVSRGSVLVAGTASGSSSKVVSLKPSDGSVEWENTLTSGTPVQPTPTEGEYVYAADDAGEVYALDPSDGSIVWQDASQTNSSESYRYGGTAIEADELNSYDSRVFNEVEAWHDAAPFQPDNPVLSIEITLGSSTIDVGQTTPATVTATREDGSTEDVTPDSIIQSQDFDIAIVSNPTVFGEGEGDVAIQAKYTNDARDELFDQTTLTVNSISANELDLVLDPEDIGVGDTSTASVLFTPDGGSEQDVTGSSTLGTEDPSLVTINNPDITGDDRGNALITAEYVDSNNDTLYSGAILSIDTDEGDDPIEPPADEIDSIELTLAENTIDEGQTTEATVIATDNDGNVFDVTSNSDIQSEDLSIALVSNPIVFGEGEGTTGIVANYSPDGSDDTFNDRKEITVSSISADELELQLDPTTIDVGGSSDATVLYTPDGGSEQDVTSSSDIRSEDTDIATVSGSTVDGLKDGVALIAAEYTNNAGTTLSAGKLLGVGEFTDPIDPIEPPSVEPGLIRVDVVGELIDEVREVDFLGVAWRVSGDDVPDLRNQLTGTGKQEVVDRIDGGFDVEDRSRGRSTVELEFKRDQVRPVTTWYVDDYEEEIVSKEGGQWEIEADFIPEKEKAFNNEYSTSPSASESDDSDLWYFEMQEGDILTQRVTADLNRTPEGEIAGVELELVLRDTEVRVVEESLCKLRARNYRQVPDGEDVIEDESDQSSNTFVISAPRSARDSVPKGDYLAKQWETVYNRGAYIVTIEADKL